MITVGNHYSIKYNSYGKHLLIYGLCVGKVHVMPYSARSGNFSGPRQYKYTFENCIVYNEDTLLCYKVISDEVVLWENSIRQSKIINHDAETLIYLLSKNVPNNLDAETVTLIASFVSNNMKEIERFSSPTFEALDIYGTINNIANEHESESSDSDSSSNASSDSSSNASSIADFDYGGSKNIFSKSKKHKHYKKQRNHKTKK
jgi:hypothetical protein